MIDKYKVAELNTLISELFETTNLLYNHLIEHENKQTIIVPVQLSEIFTISSITRMFLSANEELQHYEITSLLSFWEKTYFELKSVVRRNDSNTSWLVSTFENYSGQHEIVTRMLENVRA